MRVQGLAHRRTRDPHMSLFGVCDVRARTRYKREAGPRTREDEGGGSGDEGDEEGGEWCAGTRVRALIAPSPGRYKESVEDEGKMER